ncbi:MAG: inositol monophosphatase family protein [Candidatus Norongarragalinales archaeon]
MYREDSLKLAETVFRNIQQYSNLTKRKFLLAKSPGGDQQFGIDKVAERAVFEILKKSKEDVAYYSEGRGLVNLSKKPEYLFVIDPIDGTRPSAAGLESCTVSIAVAKYSKDAALKDVIFALVKELKTGDYFVAEENKPIKFFRDGVAVKTTLSQNDSIEKMFWSIEFNGHPSKLMTSAYGHLIDASANTGGIFVFNSASFSITRIVSGQLDAYVDVGNRLLREHPLLEDNFKNAGKGGILHLFPYDIAAAWFIATKKGVKITDGFGEDLGDTLLTDLSFENQRSCIAAANNSLHKQIIKKINWDAIEFKRKL